MRKLSILFLFIFVLFLVFFIWIKEEKNIQNATAIYGTWHWKQSRGGTNGKEVITPEETGVDKKLVFNTNKKVTVFTNEVETGNYTYRITKGNSIFDDKQHYLLTFNDMTYVIQSLDNKNLSILDNFAEGYVLTYTK